MAPAADAPGGLEKIIENNKKRTNKKKLTNGNTKTKIGLVFKRLNMTFQGFSGLPLEGVTSSGIKTASEPLLRC